MGGGDLRKKSDWSQNCPLNAKLGYFKHEIQLFKVLLSLKVVKFDTKMYLNFSNFRGRTSAGGGQALVQKRGQVSDGGGGIGKIFAGWGDPPVPQEKKPWYKIKLNQGLSVWEETKHLSNYQFLMNRAEQKIWRQTVDKTTVKPGGVVRNQ